MSTIAPYVKHVKPYLSSDSQEARRKVLALYKMWHRQVPLTLRTYDVPITEKAAHMKIRELFERNAHVTDLRVIDSLVVKGQMEFREVVNVWMSKVHIMNYFKDTWEKKPTDFLSKFLAGSE